MTMLNKGDELMISTVKRLKLAGLMIVTGIALSACQTTGSLSGQGDLRLSQNTAKGFRDDYMKNSFPLAFAVSEDGKAYSYYTCGGPKCRNPTNDMNGAILNCQKRTTKSCNIFAFRKDIVWKKANGTAITMADVDAWAGGKALSGAASLSNISLCKKALSSDGSSWSDDHYAKAYVAEAKNRDMKVNFCAKVTGRG